MRKDTAIRVLVILAAGAGATGHVAAAGFLALTAGAVWLIGPTEAAIDARRRNRRDA